MKTGACSRLWAIAALVLALAIMPGSGSLVAMTSTVAQAPVPEEAIQGPFIGEPVAPAVFDGDLRDLPQLAEDGAPAGEVPRPGSSGRPWPSAPSLAPDTVAQTGQGDGQMPAPIMNFKGVSRFEAGGWIPPDTNGDVGPDHYVQAVNVGFGIFDKATGTPLVKMTFDTLFDGTGTTCDNQNRGDVIALYDHLADRWILTDFSLPAGGPFLQCIAISQTGDPVSGGWYFYAVNAGNADGSWHDYPKMGVWPDAYYMTANMFDPPMGAKVWAMDREAMLGGDPFTPVSFDLGPSYWSLLPGNLEGPEPPAGSPNYLASIDVPNLLRLWKFHVDWDNPGDSTLTGPINVVVADFEILWDIPQPAPGELLDGLSDRLMMQLQYRNFGSHESLWVNHTVASGGVTGVRWYEVRDPNGTPTLYQQGTFQPDQHYRWMGSLAVDGDGNMALGYSVSSTTLKPAIRYAGRLADETPGMLPQAEVSLIEGTGVQTGGGGRWGDYSAMTVDPLDDCTFWYTQEYYEANGSNWQTRIGSFVFPSCGQPKGWIAGIVYNAETMAGLPGVPVVAVGPDVTLTVETGADGSYSMTLPAGTYALTAGPLLPGYPDPVVVPGVVVTAGSTTEADIPLTGVPYLEEGWVVVDDYVPGGNNNGYPEPGESGLLLWESLTNAGGASATNVSAHLVALSPGVTVTVADAAYPDIAPGETITGTSPFEFSIDPAVPCGAVLDFQKQVTTDQGLFVIAFSLEAKVPLPVASVFADDMESGPANWTTGGTNNSWQITEEQSHSPTHAWSDSPGGNYLDGTNAWLRSPVLDLTGKTGVTLGLWHSYDLENGWDYGYVEYSLDGGSTWQAPLDDYTGLDAPWAQESLPIPAADDNSNVAFRFRLQSDGAVTEDGWYIDDVDLYYHPFACYDPVIPTGTPLLLAPPDGTITTTQEIAFDWEAGPGGMPAGYNLDLDGTVITTTESSYVTTLDLGEHEWRVRAYNALGYSAYSEPWTVTIVAPPATPVLISPPHGYITSTQTITFVWEAGEGPDPDGYNLELDGTIITTAEPTWTGTLAFGPHQWRVQAFNDAGLSDYSAAWDLTVAQVAEHHYTFLPLVMRKQ